MVYLYFRKPVTLDNLNEYMQDKHNVRLTQICQEDHDYYTAFSAVMVAASGYSSRVKFYPQAYNTTEQAQLLNDYDPKAVNVSSVLEIKITMLPSAFSNELFDAVLADLGGGYRLEGMAYGKYVDDSDCVTDNNLHSSELKIADMLIECAKQIKDPNYRYSAKEDSFISTTPTLCVTGALTGKTTKYIEDLLSCAANLIATAEVEERCHSYFDVQEMAKDIQSRSSDIKEQLNRFQQGEAIELRPNTVHRADNWIPIEDRLPPLGVDVLCQFEEGIEVSHLQQTTHGFEWSCDEPRWALKWKYVELDKPTSIFV